MNERHEGSAELLIARGNAAELLELVEEPLNLLAPLVLLLVIVNRFGTIRPRGNDRLNLLHPQKVTDGIVVVCLSLRPVVHG